MTPVIVAGFVFGCATTIAGWFILRGSTARRAGYLVAATGIAALLTAGAAAIDADALAERGLAATEFVLAPTSFLLYPRARLASMVTMVALVCVLGSGVLAVAYPEYRYPAGWVSAGALMVHTWWRLERDSGDDRRALIWSTMAWGAALFLSLAIGFAWESTAPDVESPSVVSVLILLLLSAGPVAMAVGVVSPDLVDVRGLVTQCMVALTVGTVFLAVTEGLASLLEMATGRVLAAPFVLTLAAVAAFGVHRLSKLLRGVVDEILFGDRPDPWAAATDVADRIGDDPALALRAVREALVLPYASLVVDGTPLATTGTVTPHTRTLPLTLSGPASAELVVGLRPGDLRLGPDDEAVLRIVAPLLAQTLRTQAMAADLAASRGAAIIAIEEERRRLRRDLHDGVGPSLTGVAFAADAARNRIDQDPEMARELLVRLRGDTADAIAEIRRLVEGLRPAALDELGLATAVRQFASGLHAAGGRAVAVDVATSGDLSSLPAAVEVAAYRIVVEALTNVARHTRADEARVSLDADADHVRLDVRDNGGAAERWVTGCGLTSMRERAEEVGGTLAVGPGDGGGVVVAVLPR